MLLQTKRQVKRKKLLYLTLSLILETVLSVQAEERHDYRDEMTINYFQNHQIYKTKLGIIDSFFDPQSDTKNVLSKSTKSAYLDANSELIAYRAHAGHLGNDHANHVSSIIHQIIPEAGLRVISIYEEPSVKINVSHDTRLIAAINAAIESKVDFINISQRISPDEDWDGKISKELKAAFYRARDAGIGIIKSAGNDNEIIGSTPYTRSMVNLLRKMQGSMVIVGATEEDESGYENLANFSNKAGVAYEYMVCVVGTDITAYGASNELVTKSGTSMAAPIVTAIAGRLKQANPNLSAREILTLIRSTTRKVSLDQSVYYTEGKYGCGIADGTAALAEAKKLSLSKF